MKILFTKRLENINLKLLEYWKTYERINCRFLKIIYYYRWKNSVWENYNKRKPFYIRNDYQLSEDDQVLS